MEESTIEPSDITEPEGMEQEATNASDDITLGINETYQLSRKGLGKRLSFKSTKPRVVSVSGKGLVKGLRKGTAEIIILSGTTEKKRYTVQVVASPKKVTLPSKSITLGVKESVTFEPKITSGSHTTFTWETSNKAVAIVSKGGKITAKKAGKANITVKTHNGRKAVLKVTVAKAPASVSLNKTTANLKVGDTLRLKASLPKGTASSRLTWKSSNKNVATVTEKGIVKAIGGGTAKISVTTYNGKKAICKVTVKSMFADTYNVSVEAGNTATVKITCLSKGNPFWDVDDSSIATCSWDEGWDGYDTHLYIKGLSAGSTTVTVGDANTGEALKISVTVTDPAPQAPALSADQTNLNIEAGKSQNVRITYLNDNTIAWKVSNSNVVTCKWIDGWDGNTCQLTITGLSAGSATVTVYDKTTQEYVDIYVTVYGQVEKITELSRLMFKTIPEANAALDLKLTHYKENMYTCDYFSVLVDSNGIINTVGFFNNYGDYTLMGQWPGRSLSNAANSLFNAGFKLESDVNQLGTFTHPDLPGYRLLLKYSNSKVDYIIFGMTSSNVSNFF